MSGVIEIRNHLLDEMDLAVRTSGALIRRIRPHEWDYRPHENMRTLKQLVDHLVSIPLADLAILQEKTQPEVQQIETDTSRIADPEELALRLASNAETLKQYFVVSVKLSPPSNFDFNLRR